MIKRLFSRLFGSPKTLKQDSVDENSEEHPLLVHVRNVTEAREKVKDIAERLVVGDLSNNVNYMFIQEIGNYLSPIGRDNEHVVIVYSIENNTKVLKAEIKTTNSVYSEWISVCSQTIWHTKQVTACDAYGNFYHLGNMSSTCCEIEYIKEDVK